MITYKDANLDVTDNVEINFPHKTKRAAKGFSFTIPSWLKPSFSKYKSQIAKVDPKGRFMRNFKKNSKTDVGRYQNMGAGKISGFANLADHKLILHI